MKSEQDKREIRGIVTRISKLLNDKSEADGTHYSYAWLAENIGTGESTVASWLYNEACPSVLFIDRISKLFDVSLDYLIRGGTNDKYR